MRSMRFALLCCVVAGSVALAKPTVVLSGPPALTKAVGKELAKKYAVKSTGAIAAMPTAKEVRDVTAPAKAVALVQCSSSGAFITLQVLNGADGTPLDTVSFKGNARKLKIPKPNLAALIFAIGSGKPPGKEAPPPPKEDDPPVAKTEDPKKEEPKEEPKKEDPKKEAVARKDPPKKEEPRKEEKREEKKEEPSGGTVSSSVGGGDGASPHTAIRLGVGVGGFNRSFSWAGNPSPSLATANQPFSGDISVDASWYPGAHFTKNFLGNLGAYFTGDFGVGMVSRVQDSRFAHSASRLRFGGLVRLPVGDRFTPYAHVGYARQELTTSLNAVNDGSARPNIPNVLFNGFRVGVGLRLRIVGTFEIDALGGFQTVAGKGELGTQRYFPAATAFAVDAGGGLSIEIASHLRLRGGVDWQRYFITLNPADDATFFAQTAADQYILATARIEWAM
jgi:outer membrane biosynthesis protein TonB